MHEETADPHSNARFETLARRREVAVLLLLSLVGATVATQPAVAENGSEPKLKISGYVQARWEASEAGSDSVLVSGSPPALKTANVERFFIRRARFKLAYAATDLSQGVVYLDGGQDRDIQLLEAYVTLLDPWTEDHRHRLTVGQMSVPFGWEIERSSGTRELPERSRAENVLFRGERDRGVKLESRLAPKLETTLGVFNGGGIKDPEFPDTDPTRGKDYTLRARWKEERVHAAVSYYGGRALVPLTGPDIEVDRTRLGFDAQATYEMRRAGSGAWMVEIYVGKNSNADSIGNLIEVVPTGSSGREARQLRTGADPAHLATDFVGWYVMWVQALGQKLQVAARYDAFDPDTDVDHDQYARVSLGLNYFHDRHSRITVSYEMPETDRALVGGGFADPKDNLWTVQFQYKF